MKIFACGVAVAVAVVLLAACTSFGTMFPLNSGAQAIGAPKFQFVRQGIDRGPVTITTPDGEVLLGRYQVTRNAAISVGFGSFSGFGTGSGAFGTSSATSVGFGGNSPAFASPTGPKTSSIRVNRARAPDVVIPPT